MGALCTVGACGQVYTMLALRAVVTLCTIVDYEYSVSIAGNVGNGNNVYNCVQC